jgi:thymidylate synthase (FAD)
MALDIKLIACTAEAARVVAAAAKLCYSASSAAELFDGLDEREVRRFVRMLRSSGHMSPFEHASFTYVIEGASRVMTHQLVRHRIASYSQQSQRYVATGTPKFVVPPEIDGNPEARGVFESSAMEAYAAYERMVSLGAPKEDARFILPHGWETSIMITMNARELCHFFELRLCRRAQWEIRDAARKMLSIASGVAPELFDTAGPPCVSGGCRELNPCGRPYGSVKEVLEDV